MILILICIIYTIALVVQRESSSSKKYYTMDVSITFFLDLNYYNIVHNIMTLITMVWNLSIFIGIQ